jgi:hypothetical protein
MTKEEVGKYVTMDKARVELQVISQPSVIVRKKSKQPISNCPILMTHNKPLSHLIAVWNSNVNDISFISRAAKLPSISNFIRMSCI